LHNEKILWFLQDVYKKIDSNETFSYKLNSTVKMSIELSGKIMCVACNAIGCHDSTKPIFVSGNIALLILSMFFDFFTLLLITIM